MAQVLGEDISPDQMADALGDVAALAEEMKVPLLAQIPLVQGICDSGDQGTPAALHSDTATGIAFINLAQSVVTVVNKRNRELPKTQIVGVK